MSICLFIKVEVLPSLQRPKKIGIQASDGKLYVMMCKPKVRKLQDVCCAALFKIKFEVKKIIFFSVFVLFCFVFVFLFRLPEYLIQEEFHQKTKEKGWKKMGWVWMCVCCSFPVFVFDKDFALLG